MTPGFTLLGFCPMGTEGKFKTKGFPKMTAYVYEVMICYSNGAEIPKGELIVSDKSDLDKRIYEDDNPRAMASNEFLRHLYDCDEVVIHGIEK